MLKNLMKTSQDPVLAGLRLILGVVFFAHGAQKALGSFGGFGFEGTMGYFQSLGIPYFLGVLAIAAEFLGGLGLMVGLLGRVAAAGIVVNMLVAISLVHWPSFFMNWNQAVAPGGQAAIVEGIEFHLLVIAIGLTIIAKGSGAPSLDRMLSRDA
jgi:putative oxidoreductase